MADSKTKNPDPEMKKVHVARYKKGRLRYPLLHVEGVDQKPMARYDRFEMDGGAIQIYAKITATDAVIFTTLGSIPEEAGRLRRYCNNVYARVKDQKSDKWIDDMVQFLRFSNDRVYRHIV
jgi:hypothetical protein